MKITRIFNTYGPRIRADGTYARAVPRFIVQALTNNNITIYGDGGQTRAFCYVSDTITGILKTLSIKEKGEVYNLGSPEELTILQLAETVKELAGSSSQLFFKPRLPDDPTRRCADISKAERMLKWKPTTELRKGLEKTINWFAKKLGEKV